MLVKTFGSAVHGINATTVTVEVHIGQGINFYLVILYFVTFHSDARITHNQSTKSINLALRLYDGERV